MLKILQLYVCSFQKRVHVEDILIKLNVFFYKRSKNFITMKFEKRSAIASTKINSKPIQTKIYIKTKIESYMEKTQKKALNVIIYQ